MPDYQNLIGSTSAVALGYIAGGTPGSITGYKLYQKYRNMPTNYQLAMSRASNILARNQKRKASVYLTPPMSNRKRQSINPMRRRGSAPGTYGRSASVSSSSKSRQRSVGGTRRTAGANNSLNNATKFGKKGKIATRHRKVVKVSKGLRAKIKTVVEDKGTQGRRVQLWNDHFLMGPAQNVAYRHFHFNNNGGNALLALPHVYFTPDQIVNSASIMFNQKPVVQNYNLDPSAKNFGDFQDTVFDIKSQKVTYILKNNSQRHYDLTVTIMSPKNNTDALPQNTIDDAAAADIASLAWQGSATVAPTKDNIAVPWQQSPTLKRAYKMETTLIKIDPGASTSFVVHGYTGRFNRKKSIKEDQSLGTVHWTYPKGDTKFVVMDAVPNLVALTGETLTSGSGRWVSVPGTAGAGILIEIKSEIVMDAPGIKPVGLNRNVQYFENYSNNVSTTGRTIGTQDVDDEGRGIYAPQDA